MSRNKNIDDLFREGLSGLTVQPSGKVWGNIETGYLAAKGSSARKKFYYALAAFLLLTAGLSGWYFYHDAGGVEEVERISEITGGQMHSGMTTETTVEPVTGDPGETLSGLAEEEGAAEAARESGDQVSYASTGVNERVVDATPRQKLLEDLYGNAEQPVPPAGDWSSSIYTDIGLMTPIVLGLPATPEAGLIDPEQIEGLDRFLEKHRKSHFYTGISGMAGMMYYPSTRDQFTWSADLAVGLTAGRFYFETGIGCQDIREKGIYTIELRSYDSVGYYNEVQSFEVNPLNPNEITYKTEEVTVYDSIMHYRHAQPTYNYGYLNVPLIVGYRVYQKEKLTVGLETGLQVSFLTSRKQDAVQVSYPEFTHVRTVNQTPERVNINYRWLLALRLDYRFARSMSVSVKPVFNKYLNAIYDTKAGYTDTRPYSMGVQVGISFGF